MEYIVSRMKSDAHPDYYTVSSISHLLSMNQLLKDHSLRFNKIPLQQWGSLNAMWGAFLLQEMSFLRFTEQSVKTLALGSDDFANLYTGSRFMQINSAKDYTSEEAMSIGSKMWGLAVSEGVKIDDLAYYRAPALFFSAEKRMQGDNDDIAAVNRYIKYRHEISVIQKDINNKYIKYLSSTKAWLSRGKLADYIISQCAVLSPDLPDIADAIRTSKQKRVNAERFAKQNYLNDFFKPCAGAPESLEDEYIKQTAAVADSFRELDKYLIISAINKLSEDESAFISSPKAEIHSVSLRMTSQRGTWSAYGFAYNNDIRVSLKKTDLIAVQQENQERIYALKTIKGNQKGYQLIRVDRDINKYINSGILNHHFGNKYIANPLTVTAGGDIFNYSFHINNQLMASGNENLKSLVSSLSDRHRVALYDALYQSGNDKSDLQKVWRVVKHLIPFYDCIEGSIKNDPTRALPACFMDALAVIPFLGQAASLSGKFGLGVARGLQSSAKIASREGIKAAAENVLRGSTLPTTEELASLGKMAVRAADPGFELVTVIGRNFADKIIKLLQADKKTVGLAKSIAPSGLLEKLPQAVPESYVMGRLPGSELEVPVRVVSKPGDGSHYVRVNPETGEMFGKRYPECKIRSKRQSDFKCIIPSPRSESSISSPGSELFAEERIAADFRDIIYPRRVLEASANVQLTPGIIGRAQVINFAQTDPSGSYTVFGSSDRALELIHQQLGQAAVSKARTILTAANSAEIIVDKAQQVLSQALSGGNAQLLSSLREEISDITGRFAPEAIDEILHFMHRRASLSGGILEQIGRNDGQGPAIVFFFSPDTSYQAFVTVADRSRSIFFNINSEGLSPHKFILHEVSHFTKTQDFIYQVSPPGLTIPIKEMLKFLRFPRNVDDFRLMVPEYRIRDLFAIPATTPVTGAHYQAAFQIVNAPGFATDMLKGNADSFVEFIETIDKKYLISDNQITVNPYYVRRSS